MSRDPRLPPKPARQFSRRILVLNNIMAWAVLCALLAVDAAIAAALAGPLVGLIVGLVAVYTGTGTLDLWALAARPSSEGALPPAAPPSASLPEVAP